MMRIARHSTDISVLDQLIIDGLPMREPQPDDYTGYAVLKPWGYEFQVFNTDRCSVWAACLRPNQSVSMHCHQTKQASFIPLGGDVDLKTLRFAVHLDRMITVDAGVFHSQENTGTTDAFFLEYETPSDKADLVRYKDRYGREKLGYEGKNKMVPIDEVVDGTSILKRLIYTGWPINELNAVV
jgi:mannose-6-phosphate isomerase-like protein (cupin superfamily)